MKYYVTLKNKTYEVEVLDGEAALLSETDNGAFTEPVSRPGTERVPAPKAEPTPHTALVPPEAAAIPAPVAAPAAVPAGAGTVAAPMPGEIMELRVTEGQQVAEGDVLLILEAMKMENEITATASGVVQKIYVTKGQSVQTGDALVLIG